MPNSENIIDFRDIPTDIARLELENKLDRISDAETIWLISKYEPCMFYSQLKKRNLFYQHFSIDHSESRLLICKY